jgi:DNA-directed RNA polymerase specialized sigma24 family protein
MSIPEAQLPQSLPPAQVLAELEQLFRSPAEHAKARKLARLFTSGLRQMSHEDLLQEAATALLDGRRSWPTGFHTLVVLKGVMQSIAYNARKKQRRDYALAGDFGAPSDEDAEDEVSDLAEGTSPETDPARIAEAEDELTAARRAVGEDSQLVTLLEAMAAGFRGKEIPEVLDVDAKTYDAARKRLSRRLAELKKDRSTP